MDWLNALERPENALAVLTAMITPAVLISACGALIFSTSSRLGRVVDRVRWVAAKLEEITRHPESDDMAVERRALLVGQLHRQTIRARLIQRSMVAFYSALGVFVTTSLAAAVIGVVARHYTWVAVALGLLGALFMLYGSVLLIVESGYALGAITSEMDFVRKVSQRYAADDLAEVEDDRSSSWFGRKS
ncbi:MAG: DUF2721 domain-containing protein [Vicinamibacterales bacterium]